MRWIPVAGVSAMLLQSAGLPVHAAPRITCGEPAKDFGTLIANTQSLEHAFTVRSRGDADLQIQGIVSGCGCATANAGEKTLRPAQMRGPANGE